MKYKKLSPIIISHRIVLEIIKNIIMAAPAINKLRRSIGVSVPSSSKLNRYAFDFINKVQRYCGDVRGKDILEIGPGDSLITGMSFLMLGAKSYTILDRFPRDYDSEHAHAWYKLLYDNWPYGDVHPGIDFKKLVSSVKVYTSAQEIIDLDAKYDLICSNFVGEHVGSIQEFSKLTRRSLKSDGVGLHAIDFTGHQISLLGDPFLFLKINNFVWKLMGSNRGYPNRFRYRDFYSQFLNDGFEVAVYDVDRFEQVNDSYVDNRLKCDSDFLISHATFKLVP